MSEELNTIKKVLAIVLKDPPETALKRLEGLVSEDAAPVTPLLCAISIVFGKGDPADYADEEKQWLDKFVTEGEKRAGEFQKGDTPDALLVRGLAQLLRLVSDQVNERAWSPYDVIIGNEQAKSLIQHALLKDPSNEVYELAHAVSLRFFPTRLKDKRMHEGIVRLQTLSHRPGTIGVGAKLMLTDHALRQGDWDLLLETSQDLKRAFPKASCVRAFVGVASSRLQKPAAARELRAALKMNPNEALAKRELDYISEAAKSRPRPQTT